MILFTDSYTVTITNNASMAELILKLEEAQKYFSNRHGTVDAEDITISIHINEIDFFYDVQA